ncbi:MAG: hypothetical protein IJ068_01040 [Bacilli bacterium]|nr:hypothetical protein [Bacilli bacterium]
MKKTILLLVNGFGVEKKNSYSIYDDSLMPTFAELSKKYLFSNNSVISKVNNIYDAYRNVSMNINEPYNYSILDSEIEDRKLGNNEILLKVKNDFDTKNGNLHFFCLVDTSLKIVDHLKYILKTINPNSKKKIFLHLIISSNSIEDYKYLTDVFSHINMDLAGYAEIGFILGLNSISNDAKQVDMNFFFRMFISKVGEKWQSFTQKFDVLYAMKTLPYDTKPFIVNSNFSLEMNDTFFIYNYDNVDLTNFITTLSNISYGENKNNYTYYSLFPVISNMNISHIYESITAKRSLATNLETLGAKALIFCNANQVNIFNYFCNGLKNEQNETLSFVDIKPIENNPEVIFSTIEKMDRELTIINYNLDEASTTTEIKDKLKMVDNLLKVLETNRNGNRYTVILSSLYGMVKSVKNENDVVSNVIFSNELPFLYIDDFLTKKDYLITSGSINDIINSCYKSLNERVKCNSLVERKNSLYKLFFK